MNNQKIYFFIGSSDEVQEERRQTIFLLNKIKSNHQHLNVDTWQWEHSIPHGNYPDKGVIQNAIDPYLADSHVCIFIFHSKIGMHTRSEFELAKSLGKKIFVFFKTGFSPDTEEEEKNWSEVNAFRRTLIQENLILANKYTEMLEFENLFTQHVSAYLTEKHPLVTLAHLEQLTQSKQALEKQLYILQAKLSVYEQLKGGIENAESKAEHEQLQQEVEDLRNLLMLNQEMQAQQEKEKQSLEILLQKQSNNNQLKQEALIAVQDSRYDEAITLLKQSAKDTISDTADTFFEIGKVYKLKLHYKEAQENFELAAKITPNNFIMLLEAGSMERTLGYANKAINYFEKALTQLPASDNEHNIDLACLLNELGLAYRGKGEYDKAITYYKQGLIIDKKIYGEEHPDIATDYNNLGAAYYCKGEYNKAITYYDQALVIDKKIYGEDHPDIATDYNNIGEAYRSKGEYDKAINYYDQALVIDKKIYGEEHPEIAIRYNNLGLAYDSKGEYDKAITYYEQALGMGKKFYGEEHPQIATYYNNLGAAFRIKGEYNKAFTYYEQALVIGKKFYGEEHPEIATYYNNLGLAYVSKGEYNKAITYYEQALIMGKKFYGEEHPDIAIRYNNLGRAFNSKGEYDKAIGYYEQALAIFSRFFEAQHPSIRTVQDNLADARANANQ